MTLASADLANAVDWLAPCLEDNHNKEVVHFSQDDRTENAVSLRDKSPSNRLDFLTRFAKELQDLNASFVKLRKKLVSLHAIVTQLFY